MLNKSLNRPLVSIIVRTKDRPYLLKQALASITSQTYDNIQVILINDGGCELKIDELEIILANRSLTYIHNQNTLGRSEAGNAAFNHIEGRYFGFLDDDDTLFPDHIDTLVSFLENSDYKVVYSDVVECRKKYNAETQQYESEVLYTYSKDFNYPELLIYNYIPFNALLFDTRVIKNSKMPPDSTTMLLDPSLEIYEDWDFLIRLSKKYPFYHIQKVTASYNKWSDELQVNNLLNEKIMRNNQLSVISRYVSNIPADFLMSLWQQHQHESASVINLKKEILEKDRIIENRQSIINDMEEALEKERSEISSLQATLHDVHVKFYEKIKEQEDIIENRQSIINDMEVALKKERSEISSLQSTLHDVHVNFNTKLKEQEVLIESRQLIINDMQYALEKSNCETKSLENELKEKNHQFEELIKKESEYISIIGRCKEELNISVIETESLKANLTASEQNCQNLISIHENQINSQKYEIIKLKEILNAIYISLAWRLITKYRILLEKIIPEGSIGRKCYQVCRRVFGGVYRFILAIKRKYKERREKSNSIAFSPKPEPISSNSLSSLICENGLETKLSDELESDTILLVSHDFEKAGAQINLVNMGNSLKSKYGKNIIFIALQNGAYRDAFEKVGDEVIDLNLSLRGNLEITPHIKDVFKNFRDRGINKCICNTVVSGILAPVLNELDFCFINLIHELPVTIEISSFHGAIPALKQYSKTIVFSSEYARNIYIDKYNFKKDHTLVKPQGSYFKSIPLEDKKKIRRDIREQLYLTEDSIIILSCGYMTLRKGPDIFINLAKQILQSTNNSNIHFVWLGGYEPEIMNWMKNDIKILDISDNVHFVDFVDEPASFFAGADIFVLTSREDPFPTVVLEAMDNYTPAIAFDGAGGIPELFRDGCGVIVPYLDVDTMGKEILTLLADSDKYQSIANLAKKRIQEDYDFDRYTGFLLELLDNNFSDHTIDNSSDNHNLNNSDILPQFSNLQPLETLPEKDKNLLYISSLLDSSKNIGEYYKPLKHNLPINSAIKMIAFYLPQFHPIDENDKWWGKGFTEWSNVSKAIPQFVGHDQPRLPGELGFYDLRLIDIQRRQAELAKNYGIYGFCYYYYWFGGRRVLERPLEQLVNNPDIDFPFCLCWANENWSRRWDGSEDDILLKQEYSLGYDEKFIQDISTYFLDKRYIKIDGKPILLVYRAELLPDPLNTAILWRNWCFKNNIGEIYLCNVHSFESISPESIGFDAAIEFPPNTFPVNPINDSVDIVNPDYKGIIYDYRQLVDISTSYKIPDYPKHRGITTSWDNEPRKPGRGTTFINSNPDVYEKWLSHIAHFTDSHFKEDEKIIFINAWNEWAEGACLEPDRKNGYAYLESTYSVISKFETEKQSLIKSTQNNIRKDADIAVIVHLFYADLWEEINSYLKNIPDKFDLYISVNDDIKKEFIEEMVALYPNIHIFTFENRGRDILPFINILNEIISLNYKYICKIHSKKSTHTDVGQKWRRNIYKELLGNPEQIRKILDRFDKIENLGIVAPGGYLIRLNDCIGYNDELAGKNMGYIKQFLNELDAELIEDECFVTGTMFWFRPEALKRILSLNISSKDYPIEDRQIDGTIMHAIERIITLCARISGYKYIDTTIL
ncbi:MAG: glycoside hydrolase family 99-like domain-containing protein [Desulfamplus sp.]|nr:glycoside hydrolase family 99-like domain-containing protein [Desulfamplus sp.]